MERIANSLFTFFGSIAARFLRFSLAVVLFWIGALKFTNPDPVVGLLDASFPFLAYDGLVYVLGAIEVTLSILLLIGFQVRYVGLALIGLFGGTLAIFVIAPSVSYGDKGFPNLTLDGQFLLKDLVLLAASVSMVATEAAAKPVARLAARHSVHAA